MWKQVSNGLHRASTGLVTLAVLAIFALFMLFVFPAQSAQASRIAGEAGAPDTSLFYSPASLYRMAEAYGPDGRAAYIRAWFTFDLVFPLVYGAFLVTALGWLSSRFFAPGTAWQFTNLIPFLGVIFDYLENITAALVLGRYPAQTPVADVLAPIFTLLKWVFVGGSMVVLVIVLLVGGWRWLKAKK